MVEKKTGAIKIDWFNFKIQFSPNIDLIFKKTQSRDEAESIKESTIWFEILSDKIEKSECKTYNLENDEINETELSDKSNPWYFDFCGEISLLSEKEKASFASPDKIPQEANTRSSTLIEALKKSSSEPSPPAQPQVSAPSIPPLELKMKTPEPSSALESKSIPKTTIKKQPIRIEEQIKHLEEQLESTRNIILSLDKRFSSGLFNLEEYLEKKNFLIKKTENFKIQIENLKK
jgi:hypothetical protein